MPSIGWQPTNDMPWSMSTVPRQAPSWEVPRLLGAGTMTIPRYLHRYLHTYLGRYLGRYLTRGTAREVTTALEHRMSEMLHPICPSVESSCKAERPNMTAVWDVTFPGGYHIGKVFVVHNGRAGFSHVNWRAGTTPHWLTGGGSARHPPPPSLSLSLSLSHAYHYHVHHIMLPAKAVIRR